MAVEKSNSRSGGGHSVDYSLAGDEHSILKALLERRVEALASSDLNGGIPNPSAPSAPAALSAADYLDILDEAAAVVEAAAEASFSDVLAPADEALVLAAAAVESVLESQPGELPELMAGATELLNSIHYGDWLPILHAVILLDPRAPAPLYDPSGLAG